MPALSLSTVLATTNAHLVHEVPDREFTGIATDSRNLEAGELFVALKGERFDGHEFVAEAMKWGATGALVAQKLDTHTPRDFALLKVKDTLAALGELGSYHRRQHQVPVIAVTGSVGKTTTKEMISCVLRSQLNALSALESYNNEVGVPLTLLRLDSCHRAVVLEMAMRGAGQIAHLARLAQPTIGVITNIGESHLELLGSQEAIAEAKGELIAALPADGRAVLNRDDPFFDRLADLAKCKVASYGFHEAARVLGANFATDGIGCVFRVHCKGEDCEVRLPVAGLHNAVNALAAIAVGQLVGLALADCANALRDFDPPQHRLCITKTQSGVTVIDDCYNASPASASAALQVARDLPISGKRIFIFGDMKELGARSEEAHREVGVQAAEAGFSVLITVGDLAQLAAHEAQRHRPGAIATTFCDTPAEALDAVRAIVKPGDLVLVKASRALKLEEVADGLMDS